MKTILNIIKKEFLQFKRDPKMFAMILVAPVMQLIFLGFAANMDVNTVNIAVINYDKGSASLNFINEINSSSYLNIVAEVDKYEEGMRLIEKSDIIALIIIPEDFEKKIKRIETTDIQILFDGSDGNKSSLSAGYLTQAITSFSNKLQLEYIEKTGRKVNVFNQIKPEIRTWYNPEMKSRVYMVPAIVGMLLMLITMLLTSLAIVKEREVGTLEQLIVTPIKPFQLVIGKIIPFALLGIVSIIVSLSAMYIIFGIAVRGSLLFLFISSFVFILSTLGFGMFFSTISKTQQQAMMLTIFIGMMPMIYFSGFAFPIETMPKLIQYLTYLIPLRYFVTIIRGVILKGIGFTELYFELFALLGLSIVIFVFSIFRFKKKSD